MARAPVPQRGLVAVDGLLLAPPKPGENRPPLMNPSALTSPDGLKTRETMIKGMFTPKTPADVRSKVLKMMLAAPAEVAPKSRKDRSTAFPGMGGVTAQETLVAPEASEQVPLRTSG